MKKPSSYTSHPMDSIFGKWEYEQIARNIMIILKRTGDEWRKLSWGEYTTERQKDSGFTEKESDKFAEIADYCSSAENADKFCKFWYRMPQPTK